ncbi:cytochrome P450 [Saitoella complicata NRRL Y-17804]|uniref:cytochrome P450 n=1 Tax=Saitoella complicata (strain BCRC 22490 / CBS 7301 / JCM 7358 / NBRC 10748 / NRRL Y-17804) TaxID=698492 RepID=UPI0008674D23|nr:cytochrome P450 [Saitoella complicata NRRL Y-17804]ODQ55491.1 cytochrome P450 [Saitoella complicata NRRL Y-17804]
MLFFVVSFLAIIAYLYMKQSSKKQQPLPPGPPGLPFIGNALYLRKNVGRERQMHKELRAKYGDMVYLKAGPSTNMLLVFDERIAQDLFVKRGAIYSSRPDMKVLKHLDPHGIAILPYGKEWKTTRKLFHGVLGTHQADRFRPHQDYESVRYSANMLHEPEKFVEWSKLFTMSSITSILLGLRMPSLHTPIAEAIHLVDQILIDAFIPGRYLVDFFPFLDALPDIISPWRRGANAGFRQIMSLYLPLWHEAQERIKNGTMAFPTCSEYLVDVQKKDPEFWTDERIASGAIQDLIFAASDTSSSYVRLFEVMAGTFPDKVKKAQEELDAVIGPNRLPTWEDEPNLPYVRAFIKEVHRYYTFAPFAVPHAAMKDDVHTGHRVTHIMHHNPEHYPEPESFSPERFLDHNLGAAASAALTDTRKRDHFAFGFGRRICPGIHVAENGTYIQVSRLLWGFNFGELFIAGTKQRARVEDVCRVQLIDGVDYEIDIKPRNPRVVEVIEREWNSKNLEVESN